MDQNPPNNSSPPQDPNSIPTPQTPPAPQSDAFFANTPQSVNLSAPAETIASANLPPLPQTPPQQPTSQNMPASPASPATSESSHTDSSILPPTTPTFSSGTPTFPLASQPIPSETPTSQSDSNSTNPSTLAQQTAAAQAIIAQPTGNPLIEKLKTFAPKIIIGFVILVVVASAIYSVRTFLNQQPNTQSATGFAQSGSYEPVLSLSADKENYLVGEKVTVKVIVDTAKVPVNSIDTVIKYDPKFLEPDTNTSIKTGSVFTNYPLSTFNTSQSVVLISGTNDSTTNQFNGIGEFAEITFKTKSAGTTKISFDFTPDKTNDTNILESGSIRDILKQVKDLEVTIK